jgi:hypothetical protein
VIAIDEFQAVNDKTVHRRAMIQLTMVVNSLKSLGEISEQANSFKNYPEAEFMRFSFSVCPEEIHSSFQLA